jgi:hypothetical protein
MLRGKGQPFSLSQVRELVEIGCITLRARGFGDFIRIHAFLAGILEAYNLRA